MPRTKYDVVVVGGGTAGVSAAIASARAGANTVLVERLGALGGQMNITGPPGFAYAHLFNDRGEQIIGGIVEETHHRLEKEGHALPYPEDGSRTRDSFAFVDPDWWGLLVFQMMQENGVRLLLHSLATGVVKGTDRVKGVVVENPSGRQRVPAKVVVDCTGEGDIAARAGAPIEQADRTQVEIEPPSISFTMDGIDWEAVLRYVQEHPEEFANTYPNFPNQEQLVQRRVEYIRGLRHWTQLVGLGSLSFRSISQQLIAEGKYHKFGDLGFFFTPRDGGVLQATLQHSAQVPDCDCTDVEEMTRGEIEARRQAVIALDCARKYLPGFKRAYLTRLTLELRVRETRRVMGDYKLTLEDARDARKFPDVIGKSVMSMGSHHTATINTLSQSPKGRVVPKDRGSFDIPYRCLVPKGVENLLVAGKMISADRDAYLRFLPETMVTGQAAGVAAALCAKSGKTPRELETDVAELQAVLVQQGAILHGTH